MLRPDQRLALYMEGKLGAREGKMGYGLGREGVAGNPHPEPAPGRLGIATGPAG